MTLLVTVDPVAERVAATLDAVADYIEEHGWCQGLFADAGGAVCADRALRAVSYGDELANARAVLHAALSTDGDVGLPQWNDMPGRQVPEVLNLFRTTANETRSPT
jgi:hypothetical protein